MAASGLTYGSALPRCWFPSNDPKILTDIIEQSINSHVFTSKINITTVISEHPKVFTHKNVKGG